MQLFKQYELQQNGSRTDSLLEDVKTNIGFIPNIYAAIAASSTGLDAFIDLNNHFSETRFSPVEVQIILLATSVENQCGYCVAGHTTFAELQGIPGEYVEAMRNDLPLSDPKLEILNQFTRSLVKNRGQVSPQLFRALLAVGYTQADVVNIILGVSLKTFSNLTSILMKLPLDNAFKKNVWVIQKKNLAA
jgi:AhpD family alkylhydroperoxidase